MTQWLITIRFENGDNLTTRINGTKAEVEQYYSKGKVFNLGNVHDDMQKVERIIEIRSLEI